jgi:REase_DpnII-MboI/Nucleotidyltransferase domain
MTRTYNLKALTERLVYEFSNISSLHIFGSRRYGTMSLRSDCDILVTTNDHIPEFRLRNFSADHCPALDFFIVSGAKAVSCINNSFVIAESYDDLVGKLNAVQFWDRNIGFLGPDIPWTFETHASAGFLFTTLPNAFLEYQSFHKHMGQVASSGLSVNPYIGDTPEKVSGFIMGLIDRMVMKPSDVGQRGLAKDGWTVHLSSEYDFQNLFYTVVKPWIPSLGREEITIRYDEQDKFADFNLFSNQIIVEMKYIDTVGKKADVVKTLEGLSSFYLNHANVRVLILAILVKKTVDIDQHKWEHDFTYFAQTPKVITKVVFCD